MLIVVSTMLALLWISASPGLGYHNFHPCFHTQKSCQNCYASLLCVLFPSQLSGRGLRKTRFKPVIVNNPELILPRGIHTSSKWKTSFSLWSVVNRRIAFHLCAHASYRESFIVRLTIVAFKSRQMQIFLNKAVNETFSSQTRLWEIPCSCIELVAC